MGARCYVGVLCRDGKVRYIYVQWDAYPEKGGKRLVRDFDTYGKVVDLIVGGDCRCIQADSASRSPYGTSFRVLRSEQPCTFFDLLDLHIEAVYLFVPDSVHLHADASTWTTSPLAEWVNKDEYSEDEDEDDEEADEDEAKAVACSLFAVPESKIGAVDEAEEEEALAALLSEGGHWLVRTNHTVNLTVFKELASATI